MGQRIDKVKQHIKDHKEGYICGGLGLATGVGLGLLVGRNGINVNFSGVNYKGSVAQTIINELERRGHPGYVVKCVETGESWASQARAAEVMKIDPGKLSRHLNGTMQHVNGLHFERLGEAVA